ncbi:MAG: type I methionyl aminopeptidase [Oscillospiraceae bacterium]|nr:type I methionyl aminopeptidase [Oscillospiraceae bacterium]
MIRLKTRQEADLMKRAGAIAAAARSLAGKMAVPGVTTLEIDKAVHDFIVKSGAKPTFLHYNGYPANLCISINDEVIHGIPGKRIIRDGDIVSIDVGATFEGYVGDCAATFVAGTASDEAKRLIQVTRQSFFEAMKFARVGYRISDISHAVQQYAEGNGFSVVREYVGHGVGAVMHEDPEVPNYGRPGHGPRLMAGMTIAVEPMINSGGAAIKVMPDGWTVKTADGSLSAHYENSILITDGDPVILTAPEE